MSQPSHSQSENLSQIISCGTACLFRDLKCEFCEILETRHTYSGHIEYPARESKRSIVNKHHQHGENHAKMLFHLHKNQGHMANKRHQKPTH